LCAIVACVGDSRCITDDGNNEPDSFRAVTRDHRPSDPDEQRRLKKCVAEGVAFLEKDEYEALRLYPGGLAVSRTIGDLLLSRAAVPEPDVFSVALRLENQSTCRFIIGSDGIWDTFDTEVVGRLAAREKIMDDGKKKVTSVREAAREIIDDCIKKGGYVDDVTVLVMDVSLR
jgi:serine/threonine protein phosphatase PrpC